MQRQMKANGTKQGMPNTHIIRTVIKQISQLFDPTLVFSLVIYTGIHTYSRLSPSLYKCMQVTSVIRIPDNTNTFRRSPGVPITESTDATF